MLRKFWKNWKSYARAIGRFESRILLFLFYFVILTPFGLAIRMFSDPLHIRTLQRSSNWILRKNSTDEKVEESCFGLGRSVFGKLKSPSKNKEVLCFGNFL